MPTVRVSRGGKISFPKEAMERLGIKTGDFLDFEIQESAILIRPKAEIKGEKFWATVDEMRENVKDVDPKELDQAIEEAVQASKKSELEEIARSKKYD
jgi:AbrB family looped-hinge helix DNA binding protein